MRTALVMILALFSAALPTNVFAAGNIAHGVSVVVLDAGHGGKFPGAHYSGVYEKDLTLKVVLKVGKLIEEGMPGVTVVYTRKTDKALGATLAEDLQARADIANKAGGDLFVSVHVNAAKTKDARGVETLIMGESPKEQRYNENALYESNREDLIDMSDERTAAIVRAYIQNLQFTYGEYTEALARCIQDNYIRSGRRSRGVKPQLLRVLYATDMPGVLTEIGFMTNPQEMAYMKSEKGLNEIARNIYQGIRDYSDYVLKIRGTEEEREVERAPKRSAESAPAAADKEEKTAKTSGKADSASGQASKPKAASPAESSKSAAAASGAAKTTEKKTGSAAGTKRQEPLRYTVQIMASAKPVSLRSSQFGSYRGKVKQYVAEGRFPYKYCVGEYADQKEAQRRLREVRKHFPEAFVVSCRGDRIVK